MRKGLSVEELGDLLEQPVNATLATYRKDGTVLLSPVWHEWRDGGFSIIVGTSDVKLRHIERRNQAAAVVSDNAFPFRGIEVSATPSIVRDLELCRETMRRIATRYMGEAAARTYLGNASDDMVLIRLVPGTLRTWDFADDAELFGAKSV